IVSGRATFTIPVIQRIDKLSLGLIQSNIVTSAPVPTADFIEVSVSAVVNFQISSETEQLEKATRNFLNFSKDDISKIASEVLEGSMREIIGQMYIKDMVTDRETFNARVIQTAKPDLNNMGLDLISFNVQNFQDERGVIEKLGMDQTAQITRDAAIAKIEADREVELKNADARNLTNERNTQTDRAIAEREQQLAVMRAQLQIEQDTKKAEADLAYQIQTETKTRELEIAKQEAAIAKQEKEIELKEREVQITERELEATVKKRSEADRYAKQQAAEASLFEVQKRSEAEKAQADAQRYKIEANAAAQAAMGKAEASVIEAKGQAEAKSNELQGIAVATALKEQADAYNSMQNPYALLEKYLEMLPLVAQAVAAPLGRVGSITMYGEGNVANLVEETTRTTTQLNAAISESLGFDIQGMLNGLITGRAIGNGLNPASAEALAQSPAPAVSAAAIPSPAKTVSGTFGPQATGKASGRAAHSGTAKGRAAASTVTGSTAADEEKAVADALEERFNGEMVAAQGESLEKNRLANQITQAYAQMKKLVFDPKTAEKVRGAVLESLEEADLSSLNSKQDVAAFIKNTLVPRISRSEKA
ncbi:MAG: hypothetical protein LBG81_03400, partial [Coriobacteriaceae bacterium]|nr:hypothetical protein [Coriobacteriaceae bacterium]